jgi:aspartyl-tRNA(Asn)/glutamyl-tRNA(Gln) amidotransferase subunit B
MERLHAKYDMTIGIECHVQLATNTKLFSPADNDARGAEPNAKTHPIDFGLPGMLPILNREAVVLAVKAGKALNADIAHVSRFDRKHYFYPDLPKGYQTTQMYEPIIGPGAIDIPLEDGRLLTVRIHHAHMEEDAGKLTHYDNYSLVDLNRAGTPLIEIVSEPDMHSPVEARAYAQELYHLMTFSGVTNGDLYHGNMRFDVNISVAPKGSTELGTRAEVKNLNSFRSIERASEYEFLRQADMLEKGETVVQETRGWSEAKQVTSSQRSKENAQDYRYMPDADIPPIVLSDTEIGAIQASIPKLPQEYRREWADLNVDKSVTNAVLDRREYADLLSNAITQGGLEPARRIAHWIAGASSATDDVIDQPVNARVEDLLELTSMTMQNEISSNTATMLFAELMRGATDPRKLAADKNLMQNSDEDSLGQIVDEVLADVASQKAVQDVKAGNDKAIAYLVGQVMKHSKGQANPSVAQKLIRERISS